MQQSNQYYLNILWQLLRAEVCGVSLDENVVAELTEQVMDNVYALAKEYDLGHIVAKAVLDRQILPAGQTRDALKKAVYLAMLRFERIQHEKARIGDLFAQAGISYIWLKGTVLREYYPEPWMRTSCDIDVLVHSDEVHEAAALMVEKLSYVNKGYDAHDISLFAPGGLHIELHHTLMEEGRFPKTQQILESVWERSKPSENGAWEMSEEMFYFYHILHMAGHFHNGGCGIRPLIDQWILEELVDHDSQKRENLLKQGGLLIFEKCVRKLMRVWMLGEEHDANSRSMEEYILQGGVYGTVENETVLQQAKKGSSFRYVTWKVFMPYELLKSRYPKLKKHKWLYPYYVVVRLCKMIIRGRWRTFGSRLKDSNDVSEQKRNAMAKMLDSIGL